MTPEQLASRAPAGRRGVSLPPLLELLARSPADFADFVLKKVELRLDPLWARPPAYHPVDWEAARAGLADCLPGQPALVGDQALDEIEAEVRYRWAEIAARAPWAAGYNADVALGRCLYLVCRALEPSVVVETGVAYGLSSAFLLKALEANGWGTLHSVDLPPLARDADDFVGVLVPERLRARWRLHRGTSRRKLPTVLDGQTVDLFVHDSSHTYWNMRHEFGLAWARLRSGGMLVSDDVECTQAFDELRQKRPRHWTVVRQEGKRSLFGIAVK